MDNLEIKKQILDKIKKYDTIIIARHFRPDGDAIGSTLGLATILRESFPNKKIYLSNEDYSDYVAFLGTEDGILDDSIYEDALCIIVDTGTIDRCSNKKVEKAKEIIKIDHHVDIKPYGNISWVEDWRSSACEMISDFYMTFKDELIITKKAATCIYCGMVTDSGRFKYNSTTKETFENAAFLISQGIDLDTLYAHLYLDEYNEILFKANMTSKIQMTENGVAYIYVTKEIQEQYHLTREEASNIISVMDSIKNSYIWVAFIDNCDPEETIRVRLRSRFVHINKIAENYHGGGHECASGATCYSFDETKLLLSELDALLKESKERNSDWI